MAPVKKPKNGFQNSVLRVIWAIFNFKRHLFEKTVTGSHSFCPITSSTIEVVTGNLWLYVDLCISDPPPLFNTYSPDINHVALLNGQKEGASEHS